MSNAYWKKQEEKYLKAISEVEIPDEQLNNVDYIDLKEKKDIEVIPEKGGGCYWIWTNEPIKHYFHKHITPQKFNNGEIIYNGITLKNVRARVNHHLIGEIGAGWSGISIDLYFAKRGKYHIFLNQIDTSQYEIKNNFLRLLISKKRVN